MKSRRPASYHRSFALLVSVLAFAACGGSNATLNEPEAEDVTIVVRSTGGIAGMDWRVRLDGEVSRVRLLECSRVCPWTGAPEREISDEAVTSIASVIAAEGIRDAQGIDFGVCAGCADQFHHVIFFTDRTGSYRIDGDGPSLPEGIERALARLIYAEDLGDS